MLKSKEKGRLIVCLVVMFVAVHAEMGVDQQDKLMEDYKYKTKQNDLNAVAFGEELEKGMLLKEDIDGAKYYLVWNPKTTADGPIIIMEKNNGEIAELEVAPSLIRTRRKRQLNLGLTGNRNTGAFGITGEYTRGDHTFTGGYSNNGAWSLGWKWNFGKRK